MSRSRTGTCRPNKAQVHLRTLKPTVLYIGAVLFFQNTSFLQEIDSFMFLLDTESCSKMSQNMTKFVKIIILVQGNFSKLENYFAKVFLFCKTSFVKLIIQQNFAKLENSFAKFREILTKSFHTNFAKWKKNFHPILHFSKLQKSYFVTTLGTAC